MATTEELAVALENEADWCILGYVEEATLRRQAAAHLRQLERELAEARAPISEADVARVATVAIHAVADVKDAQIATLIAERDEAQKLLAQVLDDDVPIKLRARIVAHLGRSE